MKLAPVQVLLLWFQIRPITNYVYCLLFSMMFFFFFFCRISSTNWRWRQTHHMTGGILAPHWVQKTAHLKVPCPDWESSHVSWNHSHRLTTKKCLESLQTFFWRWGVWKIWSWNFESLKDLDTNPELLFGDRVEVAMRRVHSGPTCLMFFCIGLGITITRPFAWQYGESFTFQFQFFISISNTHLFPYA